MTIATSLPSGTNLNTDADSPRGPLLIGGLAAALMLAFLLGWASFMSVAGGAISNGKVAVEGSRKAVQHRDGGTIKAILVREGQRVDRGQPLLEINPSEVQAEVSVLESARVSTVVKLARLRVEARDESQIAWPDQVRALGNDQQTRAVIEQEASLFDARLAAYHGNVKLLEQQIEGRKRQIEGLEVRLAAAQEQLKSVNDERTSLLPLLEKGLISRPRVLGLERTSSSLTAEAQTVKSQIAAEKDSIVQAETQIAQLKRDRNESVAKEIAEMEARLGEALPRLTTAHERLQRTTLVAPESGYVYGLAVFSTGAVIVPGQTVLEIVPESESLVLQVEVHPQDIKRVHPGQQVIVHLLAYSQRYQSVIKGRLEKVSPDRFDDPQSKTSYYRGEVKVDQSELKKANVELVPGMPVQVVIETGERTIMSYLLDPIFRVTDFAFRER